MSAQRQRVPVALGALTCSVLLASCGSGGAPDAQTAGTATAGTAATAPAPVPSAPAASAPATASAPAPTSTPPGAPPAANAPSTSPTPAEPAVVARGDGRLSTVPGGTARSGEGPLRRYRVEVEGGLGVDATAFAETVDRTLADPRSWGADGRLSFQRVASGPVDILVVLASPETTDDLCRPLHTGGLYSCGVGSRAVINSMRWLRGADAYDGHLTQYRQYVVNHEVGHTLGHSHEYCSGAGRPAPVMMQQTKGVGACRPVPWPYA